MSGQWLWYRALCLDRAQVDKCKRTALVERDNTVVLHDSRIAS
jgi:hypothetical protein